MEARQGAMRNFFEGMPFAGSSLKRAGASCPQHLMRDLENRLPTPQPGSRTQIFRTIEVDDHEKGRLPVWEPASLVPATEAAQPLASDPES
jgi:hypothetical protein